MEGRLEHVDHSAVTARCLMSIARAHGERTLPNGMDIIVIFHRAIFEQWEGRSLLEMHRGISRESSGTLLQRTARLSNPRLI